MTDRDTFAAAALTGLIVSMREESWCEVCESAYCWADAMIRQRGTAVSDNCVAGNQPEIPCPVTEPMPKEKRAEVSDTNHDAAPAAKARTDADSDRTDKAVQRPGEGTGNSLSEAEIDALECVVEDGRIVGMSVYGVLRSLLVRLRPEWEDEDQEPERTHGVRHTQAACTEQAGGSVPDPRTENEPVAWAVVSGAGVYDSSFGDKAEADEWRAEMMAEMGREYFVVPLYRSPQPTLTDAERETIEWAVRAMRPECRAVLQGLLDRSGTTTTREGRDG